MTSRRCCFVFLGCIASVLVSIAAVGADLPDYTYEVWGRTSYGDGYVYGPPYRSSGVTVVDLDGDNDYDFVMPSLIGPPLVMRNLGSNRAFYPGGSRTIDMNDPAAGWYLGRYMDFADLTGDARPDAVAVCNNYTGSGKAAIYWYTNAGPAGGNPNNMPSFTVHATPIYTSPQSGQALGAVDLVDLNGDNKYDLSFVEFTMDPPSAKPRVYYMLNTGTITSPAWGARQELAPLSALLPAPRVSTKSELKSITPWLRPKDRPTNIAKTVYVDRVTDIEFGDWDADGDLDFLFYDSEEGVHWSRCINPAQALGASARWDAQLDVNVMPYTQSDFFQHVQGAFAVRQGPDVSSYPDFYVAVQGMLLTWRYNAKGDQYELVQENAVAFDAGTGSPAFWDYDGDGDLDMFRQENITGKLSLIENVGTPYSPIWDYAYALASPILSLGTPENRYRQDLYTFADGDADGITELFIQGQDGEIQYREAYGTDGPGLLPSFGAAHALPLSIVPPGTTEPQARGLAVADFNGSEDGVLEVVAAIGGREGGADYGRLVYLSQNYNQGTPNLTHWNAPYDLTLYDQNDEELGQWLIENIAATDVDRDGRPDLVLTLSNDYDYQHCTFHVWHNTYHQSSNTFTFDYAGEITAPQDNDANWARLISFADVDTDGDGDFFVGHQYIDPDEPNLEFSRYPYLHYYRNATDTGLAYWQTRVVSGQQWTFTIGGAEPTYRYVFNGSGGSISNGLYTAGPNAQTVDIIETTDLSPNYRIFIDVLPEVGDDSKAIIVVGGRSNDALYPAFSELVRRGYDSLVLQGIPKANIRVLAGAPIDGDGDGTSDTFGAPTLAGLRAAVTNWAYGSSRLLVYLVDHGQQNRFRINGTDYLNASDYASWVNQLQSTAAAPIVTTVIDTCEAGSFVDELKLSKDARKAGIKRITITGSGTGPTQGVALFDPQQSVSFSLPFWEQIWNGETYGEAFSSAKVNIESINPLQVPQIDDNGNGISNEVSDGLVAATLRPGADFDRPSPGVYIGEVAPPQTVSSNSATLWLSDVVAGFPIEAAGALIVPPNLNRGIGTGDDEQPVSGMTWVDFTYNAALKRWEAPYNGFTTGGLYRVQYYVQILGNYHASPRIGFIDRVGIADAWEVDNTRDVAPWMSLNSAQGHNFHQSGDVDWVWFASPATGHCTVAVLAQGPNCQPQIKLFKAADLEADPNAPPVHTESSPAPGRDVTFDHSFSAAEPYALRISNLAPTTNGAGTSYLLVVAADTGGIIPPTVIVVVKQQGANTPLSNAAVKAVGGGSTVNAKTTATGQAEFVCINGDTYTFQAVKAGYNTGTRSVKVNNQVETVQIQLVPQSTTPNPVLLNLATQAPDAKVTVDGVEYDLPQSLEFAPNTTHSVSVPTTLSGGLVFKKWSDNNTNATRNVTLATGNVTLTAQFGATVRPDVNSDTKLDAADLQLVVKAVLGKSIGTFNGDVNGDSKLNAADIQLVANAILAGH
jgi:hypothetical protein